MRKPPAKPGPGRPKGLKNKLTVSIKQAITEAFDGLGGVPSLIAWGKKHPDAFYQLWGRLAPREIVGEDGGPLAVTVQIVREGRRTTAS